uniref:Olfactory receptor n=1 Tax=Catagonus wagneri TaxID=51154 RepID=A0A8C3W504_9CETA
MEQHNGTEVTEFILLGFAGQHKSWLVLFIVFLVIYVVTLVGNTGMILLIKTDSSLHTPMYFFLQNLAFVDLCYTSAITPKMLQNFVGTEQSISFIGCMVQLLIYGAFATSDCYILAAMAVDRYVAICNPLHYPIVMSQKVCIQLLIAGSYVMGSINASVHTGFTFSLVGINVLLLVVFVGFNLLSTVSVIILSYVNIIAAILKMSSTAGRKKSFSTCASHLTAVTIFYGTVSYMYLESHSNNSQENMKAASVLYGIVIPTLNPLIYSLRNKEVKEALKILMLLASDTCL